MITKEEVKRKYAYAQPVFPYFDIEKSMAVSPSNLRYQMLAGVTPKTLCKEDVSPELIHHYPEFLIARWYAAAVLMDMVKEKGLTYDYIENETGIAKSLLSKMGSKELFFRVPLAAWEALCYKVLGISVHKLVFGSECEIILPKRYAIPLGFLAENGNSLYIDMLLHYAEKVYEEYCEARESDKFGHYKSEYDLQHERIGELRESAGLYKYHTFGAGENGTETPNVMKSSLTAFWYGQRCFKFSGIAYTSMYYRIAVDYLTCEMPCHMNRVFGTTRGNSQIELSYKLKRIADYMLAVDDDGKQKILSSIWAYIMHAIQVNGALFA